MRFDKIREIFSRYFIASFAIHVLILFLMRDYFTYSPSQIYQDLEVEIPPPLEEKKKRLQPVEKKPLEKKKIIREKKPAAIVKPKRPIKIRKKIPREEVTPASVDEKTELSMFKDGLGVRGKPKKRSLKKMESPVTAPKKKVVKKKILIQPRKSRDPPKEKLKVTASSDESKEIIYPFKTEDMFAKKSPPTAPQSLEEKKEKLARDILANLDEYIDADKFDDSELFGDSMLTFSDENFRHVWYGRVVKKKVVDGWYPPVAARLGLTGKAVVTFNIKKDGSVDSIKLKESTGNNSLDRASLNAIKSAGPFPELPRDYEYGQLGVIFSFWYNISRSGS
jgi:protein TonB